MTPYDAEMTARCKMCEYAIDSNKYTVTFIKEPDSRDKEWHIYFVTPVDKRILAIVKAVYDVSFVLY